MRTYVSCLFLSDILLSIMPSSFIHVVVNGRISFFPWLNDIPVCMCVCVFACVYLHVCARVWMACVRVCAYVCAHVCACVYVCTCMCVLTCVCMCVRIVCVCAWHFLYPFICWWTLWLFSGHCNNAVVNMGVQISFWSWWLYFLWIYTQKWDNWIIWHFYLNFLGNLCTILVHSGCTNLHSHEQCTKWKWKSLSHAQLFATPWAIQSMGFSRPEYWSG